MFCSVFHSAQGIFGVGGLGIFRQELRGRDGGREHTTLYRLRLFIISSPSARLSSRVFGLGCSFRRFSSRV